MAVDLRNPFVEKFPSIFDSSMIGSFKSCPQLFYKTYIQEYKPLEPSVHLHAGGAFARGIEVARRAFYEGAFINDSGEEITTTRGDKETAEAYGLEALLSRYGNFECPPDSAKSAERTAGALEFYYSNYPFDQDGTYPITLPGDKRAIEFSFAHPLPITHPDSNDPLLYVGRMDAILSYAGGNFITDEKTTTQLGASWSRQWDLRAQFSGYAWGAAQGGIKIDGAIIRGVSILKTKYDTQQAITYRPEWQIDRWYNEMLEWIEDIKICWERGKWRHNLDHSCAEYGGCTFRQVCSTSPEEAQPWLDTYFERRHWNPLLREEKKL